MTVRELLERFDAVRTNQLDDTVKIGWINDVEGRAQCELLKLACEDFVPVVGEDDALTVPDAYSSVYLIYLCAMSEMSVGNYDNYSQAMKEYEKAMTVYGKHCIREEK